jgi:hypothetical protein
MKNKIYSSKKEIQMKFFLNLIVFYGIGLEGKKSMNKKSIKFLYENYFK